MTGWKGFGGAMLGIVAFVAFAISLEDHLGIPFALSYRIACAAMCVGLIAKLRTDYPEERWPVIGLWFSLAINTGIFFTPLVDHRASKDDLMIFALPDAMALLAVRIATYEVGDDVHRRAIRQQMILALILAAVLFAIIVFLALIPNTTPAVRAQG